MKKQLEELLERSASLAAVSTRVDRGIENSSLIVEERSVAGEGDSTGLYSDTILVRVDVGISAVCVSAVLESALPSAFTKVEAVVSYIRAKAAMLARSNATKELLDKSAAGQWNKMALCLTHENPDCLLTFF